MVFISFSVVDTAVGVELGSRLGVVRCGFGSVVVGFSLIPAGDVALWSGIGGGSHYYPEFNVFWCNFWISVVNFMFLNQKAC